MYGLKRVNHLRAILTSAAAAACPKRSLRLGRGRFSKKGKGGDNCVKNAKIPTITDKNEYRRKSLPKNLHPREMVMLTCDSTAPGGICDVYLIGTCHRCPISWREVKGVIEFLQPQVVFLELCPMRISEYLHRHGVKDALGRGELVHGAEFFVANEEARKYGAKVILGDRSVHITRQRAWATLPFFLTPGFLSQISVSELAKMVKEMDAYGLILSLSPPFHKTIIDERDQYMSAKLLEVACQHNSVVAVVGMNHLPGMQEKWKQPVDMEELLRLPTGLSSFFTPEFVAVFVIAGGIYLLFKVIALCIPEKKNIVIQNS